MLVGVVFVRTRLCVSICVFQRVKMSTELVKLIDCLRNGQNIVDLHMYTLNLIVVGIFPDHF